VFAAVLAFTVIARGMDSVAPDTILAVYDLGILAAGAILAWGILARSRETAVLGLVLDVGESPTRGALRDRLAATIGDPGLVVGFWLPDQERYVDDGGLPVDIAGAGGGEVLAIDDDGAQVAVLVHEAGVLDDPQLRSAVSSATRLAVVNARLQADIAGRVAEIEASQSRIVTAADDQGRRLELELRSGPLRRLETVAALAADVDDDLRLKAEALQDELRELAHGIRPAVLTERGLAAAVNDLVRDGAVAVDVDVTPARFGPIFEATAYFVCAEGLANIAKHAHASRAAIRIAAVRGRLEVEITDDGVGGASDLRALADRVEAVGGRLDVTSPVGAGTRLAASIPVSQS
jgi:hypothetical protein